MPNSAANPKSPVPRQPGLLAAHLEDVSRLGKPSVQSPRPGSAALALYEFFTFPLQAFGNFLFRRLNFLIMKPNSQKPFQMGAVLLALTMLVSYVVYSQRQVAPTVAPGSKSLVLEGTAIHTQAPGTNQSLPRATPLVAPGSKSMAPVFSIPATNSSKATKRHVPNPAPPMLFPGSKSGAIFHPRDVAVLLPAPAQQPHPDSKLLPHPGEAPRSAFSAATNTTASFKP